MTKSVVQGYVYVVTAETTTTVTDAHGLNLTVQAGQQAQLVASGDTVELTGSATLTQLRAANFNQPAAGGGGHVVIDPVPVEGSSNAVASGGVYDAISAVSPPEGNVARLASENTFTAAQTFQAPVTVGTPRVAAVWAKVAVTITDANMRKAGTITDNAGHTLELPADSTRTQDGFAKAISDSELGLTVTHVGTAYTLYDSSSPAGQEGSLGNTRMVYLEGFGYSSKKTLSLSGGKDGVAEVGQPVMLNGNVYIGHGPEGVKARCYFGITTAYLAKAGTLTDNSTQHPLAIELPEDPTRTIDTLIAEINAQGDKLEITASKYNATNIYLESSVPGSFANSIVFTRTGCLSQYSSGAAQTITQGSNIQGLDEGAPSEWELRQNGYPVASRQTNNVYEGVQVFNNTASFNGPVVTNSGFSGKSVVRYPAGSQKIIDAQLAGELIFNEFFNYPWADSYAHGLSGFMPGYTDRTFVDVYWDANTVTDGGRLPGRFANCPNLMRIRVFTNATAIAGYSMSTVQSCPELREVLYFAPYALSANASRTFFNYYGNPKLRYVAAYFHSASDIGNFAMGGGLGKHVTVYAPRAVKAVAFSEGSHTSLTTLKLTTGEVTDCSNMLRYWAGLSTLVWEGFAADGARLDNPVQFVTAGTGVFSGCAVLPASKFPKSWPSLSSARDIFLNCSLLDAATANAILDSLPDWSMEETPADHTITFTGTAAATAWAADGADLSHVEAARAKGWVVEGAPEPVTE